MNCLYYFINLIHLWPMWILLHKIHLGNTFLYEFHITARRSMIYFKCQIIFHNVDSWVVWNDHPYILWSWQQGAQWVQRFVWLRGKVARCVPSTLYLAFTRCRCTTLRTGTMWKSDKTWMVPVASRSGRKARPVDNRFKGSLIGVIMLNWWPRNVWSVLRSALRDPMLLVGCRIYWNPNIESKANNIRYRCFTQRCLLDIFKILNEPPGWFGICVYLSLTYFLFLAEYWIDIFGQ